MKQATPVPLPTRQQLAWQDLEFGLFCHFGVNTFTGREWGDGGEDPAIFRPKGLDCRQWARAARDAGMRYAILTAKHHDGFCLWPTATTDHCVRSSPWRGGKGDVVREFVDACRTEGVLPGLYCSPWDRNASCYADPAAYSDFYDRQLRELCGNYGPLVELWFDGAGSAGYRYDWTRIMRTVREEQPDAVVFNMGDPDIRWGGNESGFGSPDLWTAVDASRRDVLWTSEEYALPSAGRYLPAEMDTVINRAGWFWHADSTGTIRSLEELVGVYARSVGHGANLLLNLAPNAGGRLEDAEVARLQELAVELRRRSAAPLAVAEGGTDALEIALPEPTLVGRFEAMEDLQHGEHVLAWVLEAHLGTTGVGGPAWHRLATGTALGHKRLGDFAPIPVRKSGDVTSPHALRPGDRLDRLLQILPRAGDVDPGRVERVVAHQLSQAMQGHGLGHAVAEAVAQVVGREIRPLGQVRIPGDEVAQSTRRDRRRRPFRKPGSSSTWTIWTPRRRNCAPRGTTCWSPPAWSRGARR